MSQANQPTSNKIKWENLEKRPKLIWTLSIIWLIILVWIGFLGNLDNIGIFDKTEAIYTEIAHQMVQKNDWITPTWNGEIFFDYPVGGYWFIALSMKLFGVNEWAIRLPVALFASALIVLGFYTLRYFGATDPKDKPSQRQLWMTAWIGAGILTMNPGWIAWGQTAVSDMFLSSAVSMAMLSFFLGYAQPENPKGQQRWYMVFPVFLAIAVLTKGPIGLVIVILSIGSFLLYLGKLREVWQEIRPLRTALIFLVIAAPWYVVATLVNGSKFIETFFGKSNFQRFTSVIYSHPGPWYFYIPWLLIWLLPWSIYLPLAILRLQFWKRENWLSSPRSNQLGLFALFWLTVTFLLFSAAATKLSGYILPLVPAGAILVTLFWGQQMSAPSSKTTKAFWTTAIFNIIIILALAIAGFLSPQLIGNDPTLPNFRQALQASGLPLRTAIIWGLATLTSSILLLRGRRWLWLPNLLGLMAFLSLTARPVSALLDGYRQLPLRQLSAEVIKIRQANEELFFIGFNRPSVVFYTQHPVRFFYDIGPAVAYLQEDKNKSNGSSTVLLMLEKKFLQDLRLSSTDYQDFGVKGGYQLIRIDKQVFLKVVGHK